jgi:hypothetical protein
MGELNEGLWGPEPTAEQLEHARRIARRIRQQRALARAGRLVDDPSAAWPPPDVEVPGEIAARFVSPLALHRFMTTPSVDHGGRTPEQELRRRGGLRRVLDLLAAAGPEAS